MPDPSPPEPLRILHVAQATVTGLAVYVSSLAAYQRTQGIDARIACPPDGALAEWAARDGVPHHAWPATRQPGPQLVDECRRLAAIVDEVDPDIVHLTSSKAGLAGRLAIRGRRPTVFSPEAWSFLVPGRTRVPARWWERVATRWTTCTLVACEEEAQAGRDAGVRGSYAVAEHGVDTVRFAPVDEQAKLAARAELGRAGDTAGWVVCVGRLCHQKGQRPLLEAWRRVRAEVPDSRLLLVGDGEDGAALRAAAPDGVDFVGARTDVDRWFAAADLAVQPSRYEALSFSVLEAMAMGRPVVAFDGIGMRTAIGPDAGAVVPMDDVDALAQALVARLEDPDRRRREGRAARSRVVERFTVERLQAEATDRTLAVIGASRQAASPRPS